MIHSTLQITKYNINEIEVLSVYRSSSHSLKDTWKDLNSLIDVDKPTLITGDFNVCFLKDPKNAITKMLLDLGFRQFVKDATHIQGGHIDHCYWLDKKQVCEHPKLERYSPYWTDHDVVAVTLMRR